MEPSHAKLREALGGRTVAQFMSLPSEDQQVIFRTHLVKSTPVVFDEEPGEADDYEHLDEDEDEDEEMGLSDIPPPRVEALLLNPFFMGSDESGKQALKESQQVYYSNNDFILRLYSARSLAFGEFNFYYDTEGIPSLAPLVTGEVTVVAALHNDDNTFYQADKVASSDGEDNDGKDKDNEDNGGKGKDDEEESSDDDDDYLMAESILSKIDLALDDPKSVHYAHGFDRTARSAQARLKDLFLFVNAKKMTLALQGEGLLDGSDLDTQQTMKDLSYAIKLLMEHFGDRFAVVKILGSDRRFCGRVSPSRSLRPYWEAPTEQARERVKRGEAPFEELMQVQMEDWTHVLPPRDENWAKGWKIMP